MISVCLKIAQSKPIEFSVMFGQSPLKQEANSLIQEINKQSCTYSTVADSYSKNSKYVVVHCSTHKSRIYDVFTQVFTV